MRELKWTIFHKIVLVILLLLIPIILLFMYSNEVSLSVVQEEIRDSLERRLSFLQSNLDGELNLIMREAVRLSRDTEISSFANKQGFENYFDIIKFKTQLEARLSVLSTTMEHPVHISVYFPRIRQVVSNMSIIEYNDTYLKEGISNNWQLRSHSENGKQSFEYYFYAVYPFMYYTNPEEAEIVVEIRYPDSNMSILMDDYKQSSQGDPFLYIDGYGTLLNNSANKELAGQVANQLKQRDLKDKDSFTAQLDGSPYLIYYIHSTITNWVLVDYVPVKQILMPINMSRNLFYVATFLLLVMSIMAAFLLYRNVQIPIGKLNKGLQKMKMGEFSTRLELKSGRDFKFVFQRFNEMAGQIQQLVDNVYKEQLAARDARLKQMQSQINPHFLYNCLYYISNMVKLGKEEAVEKMAMNLGEYFKYTTRLEREQASLEEEIRLVVNYLEIQKLRLNRIHYTIDVDPGLLRLEIPRLLLQPVVENAVIHGLEPKPGGGGIRITGRKDGERVELVVEDDGVGVPAEKLAELQAQLSQPMQPGRGYGIWNVNQRLVLLYGETAGLSYSRSPQGGLKVSLVWSLPEYRPQLEQAPEER